MSTRCCLMLLCWGIGLLAWSALIVPVTLARPADPPHPQRWLVVASADGIGVQLRATPAGAVLARLPNGAVMGLLGELVVDRGTTWVQVQDPTMREGWAALDSLTDLPVSVVSSPRHAEAGPIGGVRPVELRRNDSGCPAGFPVKGALADQSRRMRIAYTPEDLAYPVRPAVACFRTLDEAAAWRYQRRTLP